MKLATIRTGGGTRAVRVDDDAAVETGHRCVGELLKEPDWRRRRRVGGRARACRRLARLRHARHVAGEDDLRRAQLSRPHRRDRPHATRVPDPVHQVRPLVDRRQRPDPDAARRRVDRDRLGSRARRRDRHRDPARLRSRKRRRRSPATRSSTTSAFATGSTAARSSCRARRGKAARPSARTSSPPSPARRRRSRSAASSTVR